MLHPKPRGSSVRAVLRGPTPAWRWCHSSMLDTSSTHLLYGYLQMLSEFQGSLQALSVLHIPSDSGIWISGLVCTGELGSHGAVTSYSASTGHMFAAAAGYWASRLASERHASPAQPPSLSQPLQAYVPSLRCVVGAHNRCLKVQSNGWAGVPLTATRVAVASQQGRRNRRLRRCA